MANTWRGGNYSSGRKFRSMKRPYREITRLAVLVLIISGAWAVAPLPTGCTNGTNPTLSQSATDQVILRAEQTAETAKLTFNTFVHLERDNQALLEQVNPAIHQWAENIRKNGLNWIVSLRNATKLFKATRTADNQATLNTALVTLTNAVAETDKYISQSKKAITQ